MYRPAGYDDSDEDDFDEFGYFCSSYRNEKQNNGFMQTNLTPVEDHDTQLYNAILDGDLEQTKRVLKQSEYLRTGGELHHGWPALFYACYEAKPAIARYLLQEEQIDVNREYGLQTALMIACSSSRPSECVYQVVRLLIDYGAIINRLDQYGCSPLMFACREGHLEVVKEIVAESSLLSADNEGNTALFYAVNNNRLEVVKVLLRAGAQTHAVNKQGYTPRQCATNSNYLDIAELFPPEEKPFEIPPKYLCYSDYRNFIHGQQDDDPPGYYPDLGVMLFGMNSEAKLRAFVEPGLNLFEFLTLTDERLRQLGLKFPIERKRILLGLYDFHLQKWSKNSLWTMEKQRVLDCYDVLEVLENMLKHLTVMHASLLYTKHLTESHDPTAFFNAKQCTKLNQQLLYFRASIDGFRSHIEAIHKLSTPKPVLHIMPPDRGGRIYEKMAKISVCLIAGGLVIYWKLVR
ncbi:ankyrin repeat, SAM and basic leucine zipper domain-containing protein 1 [Anopheles stephensi]|uniref:ANK_REP_REGION domain-containing protein n=1 Tax=Anopheles stephensi TaxID=30069 RepID=A0A182YIU6_ANOST|nr:ankyrin repeat, SAM and basic leucine zipper domain-containing protein 1 [Anopheles stephensi]XP_035903124.1 ankyrin repeat, SAM and basic leucine zipper domain-containing protein 1 [Anopheles stephensi]